MVHAEKYLARIGLTGRIQPDRTSLADIISAHVATIPFENATSFAAAASPAGEVALDEQSIVAKMLGAADGGPRRGGYCFEHAALLRIILPEIGFNVRPALGRVYIDAHTAPTAKTHNVTVVRLDDRDLLVDPGFGGLTPTAPLDLGELYAVQRTPHQDYRLIPITDAGVDVALAPDVDVMVQVRLGTGDPVNRDGYWKNLYELDLGYVAMVDLPALNWFTSTSPRSIFTRRFTAALAPAGSRITLANNIFRKREANGSGKRALTDVADFAAALDALTIDLPETTTAAIAARLAQREHEGA